MTALEAAIAGDWAACLSALLALWRDHRAPALAAAIDRASERVRAPAVTSKTIAARIAGAGDADIGPIVELIRRQLRTQPRFGDHAVALANARPHDPRIAALLAHMFEHSPWAQHDGALDRDVLDALDAIDDPRFRERIVAAAARLAPFTSGTWRDRGGLDRLQEVAARVATRPAPASFAIDPELAELLAAPLATVDVIELYAAVYANPDDTSARIVLGDALIERGDPRGEFIQLQCARDPGTSPTRRERELIAAHGRAWLGAAEPLLQKSGASFRRGFVATGRLVERGYRDELADPVWQTIEELDMCDAWGGKLAAWLPTLRALRRVRRIYRDDVVPAIAAPRPWTAIGIRSASLDSLRELVALAPERLPALAELDLASDTGAERLVNALTATPLASRVRVRITLVQRQLAEIPQLVAVGLRELEIVPGYSFPPEPQGPSIVIGHGHASFIARSAKDLRYLEAAAGQLPGTITNATISAPAKADLSGLRRVLDAAGVAY